MLNFSKVNFFFVLNLMCLFNSNITAYNIENRIQKRE